MIWFSDAQTINILMRSDENMVSSLDTRVWNAEIDQRSKNDIILNDKTHLQYMNKAWDLAKGSYLMSLDSTIVWDENPNGKTHHCQSLNLFTGSQSLEPISFLSLCSWFSFSQFPWTRGFHLEWKRVCGTSYTIYLISPFQGNRSQVMKWKYMVEFKLVGWLPNRWKERSSSQRRGHEEIMFNSFLV